MRTTLPRPANTSTWQNATWLWLGLACLATFLIRFFTLPNFIEHIDGLFFTRGIERYSTLELRPFWPGYPVYMWLGRLVNRFTQDPTFALHLLSAICSALSLIPLTALTGAWAKALGHTPRQVTLSVITVSVLWTFAPLPWLLGTEVFSDAPAMFFGLCMMWLGWRSLVAEKHQLLWLLLAIVLGGIMIGIRLSFLPLMLVLLYPVWVQSAKRGLKRFLLVPLTCLIIFLATVAVWLGWQWYMEGPNYLRAANELLNNHFVTSSAGSFRTDMEPWSRPWRLLRVTFVDSLGGWEPGAPWPRIAVSVLLLVLFAIMLVRLLRQRPWRLLLFFALWLLPFSLWIIFVHNVDWGRYSYPVVVGLIVLAGLGLPSRLPLAIGTLALAVISLTLVSVPLALEHQRVLPLHQQLSNYLNLHLNPKRSVIFFGDNPHMLQAYAPEFALEAASPSELERQASESLRRGNVEVYILSEVFAQFREPLTQVWTPVATFCHNRYIVAGLSSTLTLYKFAPEAYRSKTKDDKALHCQPLTVTP